MKNQFVENLSWVRSRVGSAGADPYWHLVAMFYHQMSGLGRGWLTYNRDEVGAVPDDMDPEHGVWFVNFFPDVYDYIARYKKETAGRRDERSAAVSRPSCSVLLKLLDDRSDLYVGHATWHEYSSMSHR